MSTCWDVCSCEGHGHVGVARVMRLGWMGSEEMLDCGGSRGQRLRFAFEPWSTRGESSWLHCEQGLVG